MDHVHLPVVDAGLSEEQEDASWLQPLIGVLYSLEKNKFHLPAEVPDEHAQPFCALAGEFRRDDLCKDLDIGISSPDIGDLHY